MAFSDRPYYGQPPRPPMRLNFPRLSSVVLGLIIANVVVFFIDGFTVRARAGEGVLTQWGAFSFAEGVKGLQVWRWGTYMFLHDQSGIGHILWNMVGLYFFGTMVERYLGSKRFLGFYLLSGLGGSALYMVLLGLGRLFNNPQIPFLLDGSPNQQLVGASGCLFGILVACLKFAPDRQVLLFFVLPIKIKIIVWVVLLIQVFNVMRGGPNDGGSAAHLGGAIVGALLIWFPGALGVFDRVDPSAMSPDAIRRRYEGVKAARQAEKQRQLEGEVDRILAKVHDSGINSLTAKEKRILQQASESKRAG